jgi:hypothetical protein
MMSQAQYDLVGPNLYLHRATLHHSFLNFDPYTYQCYSHFPFKSLS